MRNHLAEIPEEFSPAQEWQDKQIKSSEPRMQSRSTLSSSDNNHHSNFEATPEKNIISKNFYPSKGQIQNIFFKFAKEGDYTNLKKLLQKFKYQLNIDAHDIDGETALT